MKKVNCILLIDENYSDNVFHKIQITEANICNHIKVATHAREALDYIIKSGELNQSEEFPKPDIIFLDIFLPGMNGFEFLEEFHKLNEKLKSKILIIMLGSPISPDDKTKASGFKEVTEFQNKPLTVEILHEIVEKYF